MKVKAIIDMGPPRALRDAQKLMGCLASLSQFISRLGEKGLSLYKLLRKTPDWDDWSMYFDGSLMLQGARAGVVLVFLVGTD
jgi:hypothetical protein